MSDLLSPGSTGPKGLRAILGRSEVVVVPGCQDALGARLIEQAGFLAVYMTGFGSAAALLGRPDIGLLSATEMVDNARRLVMATTLPVIADADTGYGNPLNVIRTVRDYEQAGVAAIQIEDQVAPKRCGHMEDKQVIAASEMVAKIRAAVRARTDPELVVIARTDARAVEGVEAALDRAGRYVEAGADVLFVEALETVDELERAASAGFGVPLIYNRVEGGKSPLLSAAEAGELGYRIVLLPISLLLDATTAMAATLGRIRADTMPATLGEDPFETFNQVVGLRAILELQQELADQ